MEAISSSKTLLTVYELPEYHISEEQTLLHCIYCATSHESALYVRIASSFYFLMVTFPEKNSSN
jgi:hypothetical protein